MILIFLPNDFKFVQFFFIFKSEMFSYAVFKKVKNSLRTCMHIGTCMKHVCGWKCAVLLCACLKEHLAGKA